MLEEGQIGSDYLVNLKVRANLNKAQNSDDLLDTIDYVLLHKIVKDEMAIRSKLLEHVGKRIVDKILISITAVDAVKVTVAKVNPPIGGDVSEVSVTVVAKR